jgi:hypothetical protein
MLRYAARSTATPAQAWALMARPAAWPAWSPHLRGAWGLGSPEVRQGARGAARLLGVVPVPARITAKTPGRAWTWRVGVVDMDHRVDPAPDGCEVSVTLRAAAPVEAVLRMTYGPVVALLVRHLAHVAGREDVSRSDGARRPPTDTGTPAA